ncbi:hypothetical protein QMQ05_05800 [Glutamicibacter ectropisis]|uniref:Uncharacterized protein n=1 Tax=Glutamicibacter ectropisis TaxID=3046593 RepID=A0AAU6WGE2_9MICC
MARKPNLNSGSFKRFKKNQGALAVQTPLSRTAVERGSTRWLSGSRVDIEGILNLIGTGNFTGTVNVGGVLDVTGTLNGSGVTNLSGTNNFSGVNHLTGPTDVAGNFEIIAGGQFKAGESIIYPDGSAKFGALGIASDGTMQAGLFELRPDGSANFGTLEILADGTLNVSNDINVLNTGKITAGQVVIDPSSDGGSIGFGAGGITAGLFGMRFTGTAGNDAIVESLGGQAQLTGGGSTVTARAGAIDLTATKIWARGQFEATGVARVPQLFVGTASEVANNRLRIAALPNTTVATANVHVDSNGIFYRVQ